MMQPGTGHIATRKVTAEDLDELRSIARQTFIETFSAQNTPENMVRYLEERLSPEKLAAEFRTEGSKFYFALLGKAVVGYLKVNTGRSQTEANGDGSLEIERIYVLKEFHGKNAGKALLMKAIECAREKGLEYVWLGVWEYNLRAREFYRRQGFVEFGSHIFRLGDDEQTDILMKLSVR